MSIIYIVLPMAVVLAACAVLAFIWAAKGGQFDDLDTPPIRALHGDDE
jgi:cbb3-type cytochrome oxidase maturation protein